MSKREATKAQTRQALVGAALTLFAEQGFDAPSLDAICERAGFTRGAFYVHFTDRDELIAAVVEQIIGAFVDTIAAAGTPEDLERSIRAFVALYSAAAAGKPASSVDPAALPLAMYGLRQLHLVLEACGRKESVKNAFVTLVLEGRGRVRAAIVAGQSSGTVREDLDPDAISDWLITTVLGLLVRAQAHVPTDISLLEHEVLRLLRTSA